MSQATPVYEIFYVSQCLATPEELHGLLDRSLHNNRQCGLTGMLVFSGGHFAQCLEGPREAVLQTMAAIDADARHTRVTRIIEAETSERRFAAWSMHWLDSPGADELLLQLLAGALPGRQRAERLRSLLFAAPVPDKR